MAFTTTTPRAFRVNPADLFLLERWDKVSPLAVDEQRDYLATEYVRGGVKLHSMSRCVPVMRMQHPYLVSSLPEDDQSLLASIRTPIEQNACAPIWLQTCYLDQDGNSTDEAHTALYGQSKLELQHVLWDEGFSIFEDHTYYDFGKEWQKIFAKIPQLIDSPLTAEDYEKQKSGALEAAREFEEVNDFHKSEETESDSDGPQWSEYYSGYHLACVVGYLWVADKKALLSRKVLLAWYDDCGRVVRSCRVSTNDIEQVVHLLMIGAVHDTGLWEIADIGEEYDVDGTFGPAYIEASEK